MDRDQLHELVMLLKEAVGSGTLKLQPGSTAAESLARVRFLPDGKVDPSTVDSAVRAAGLAAAASKREREKQQISLRDAQIRYFDFVNSAFGKLFEQMKEHHVTANDVALNVASHPAAVNAFIADFDNFIETINDFWDYHGDSVQRRIQELNALKSVFGGDVFPSYAANIASSVGLYMDTIVLPDPLLRLARLGKAMKPKELLTLVVKHALNVLGYRDLALAEVQPPIVVIAPDFTALEPNYFTALKLSGESDVVEHFGRMFGRRFATAQEVSEFLKTFSDDKQLLGGIATPERFIFDIEWPRGAIEQLDRYKAHVQPQMTLNRWQSTPELVYDAFLGRMMQTNDLLFKSERYAGTPLVDAPTSWQYLLWKYEYDAQESVKPSEIQHLVISKAIEAEGTQELGFLGGLPTEALIELRQRGALAELRQTIRSGINDIDIAARDAVSQVSEKVIENLDSAFAAHDEELRSLSSSKRKFYGMDISRWIGFGGVSIAAALTGNPGLGVLAAVSGMVGAPGIGDLRTRWQELKTRSDTLKRSPTGILFKHLKHKFGFSS